MSGSTPVNPSHESAGNPAPNFFEIAFEDIGDVAVLRAKGKIILGSGDEELRIALNDAGRRGKRNIVLDLKDVPYIDSAGFGELVRSNTSISKAHGGLKLIGLQERVTEYMRVAKLLTVFDIRDTEDDAVRAFGGTPAAHPQGGGGILPMGPALI